MDASLGAINKSTTAFMPSTAHFSLASADLGDPESNSTLTIAIPASMMPKALAAACDKSIMRPFTYGPRSLISTSTEPPVSILVTLALLPRGRVLWAAVNLESSKVSPFAVFFPLNPGPYQEASPICAPRSEERRVGEEVSEGLGPLQWEEE